MDKKTENKGGTTLECVDPASPSLVECSVLGSGRRDLATSHPLPQDPDRRSQWLKLISRQELTEELRSGRPAVSSAHFLPEQMNSGQLQPDALPSLLLLPTRPQFLLDGSLGLLTMPQIAETTTADNMTIEVKIEREELPTCSFPDNSPPDDGITESFQVFQHAKITSNTIPETAPRLSNPTRKMIPIINPVINITQIPSGPVSVTSQNIQPPLRTQINIPLTQLPQRQLEITPMVDIPECKPKYFDFQIDVATQTDSSEAFYRRATFSAVEHLNIPPKGKADIRNRSVKCQTDPELVQVFTAELKHKLGKELDEAKQKLYVVENPHMEKMAFLKGCDKYLDVKISNFVKSHAYLFNKFDGKLYPADFKIFALKLYLSSPKSYKFVEQFFDLPSKDVIKKFRMPVASGSNQTLMEALTVKIEHFSILGKQCVVCFDVVKLKKNLYYDVGVDYLCGLQEIDGVAGEKLAEYALLISARGLYTRWKQPISFAFVTKKQTHVDIQNWLNKTIEALIDIGLNVKALITNFDQEFLVVQEPSFEIKGRKIYNIYDFPDLLTKARDELMTRNLHAGGSVAKWEHVLRVYDSDNKQELKLLSNLTEKHVRPDETSRNDIKMALQVFSSDIAAAMHFYLRAGFQSEVIQPTVQFMKIMRDLYNVLYSRKLSSAYRANPEQNKLLKEALKYLNGVQIKNKYGTVVPSKFVSGMIFTIKSIKSLAVDLKRSNVNYLFTKNLSKDFTENYFRKSELKPIEFTRIFRRLFLSNLLNNTKTTATGDDMMGTLAKISEYVKEDMNKKEETDENANLNIDVTDYKVAWPSNEYIAGYLLRKCFERHTCATSVTNICNYYMFENANDIFKVFEFFNAENVHKRSVVRPPIQLQDFVCMMDKRFNEYLLSPNKNCMKFGWSLYSIIEKDSFIMPCECFPSQFLRKLYIRLKIFSCVKELRTMTVLN